MKIVILFSLVATTMAFPGLSSVQTWLASFQQPITNLIENPYRRSTIPRFILDTKHPWILTNRRKIEALPNAEAFLCLHHDSDSLGGEELKGMETDLEIPSNLFENLTINNNLADISRPGWPNALERLTEMNRCPLALSRVKNLHVGIYVYRGSNNDFWPQILEPSNPPSELPTLLGDVLEWMTRLEQLTWGMGSGDACFFEEPLMARNLSLPSVTSLELGASSHYLVGMCPNLEKLESGGGWYSSRLYDADELDWRVLFIQSAASATKLKSFGMDGSFKGWSPELATEVVKAMPQIENLRIRGSVGHSSYAEDNDKLKDMLEILGQLKNLTHIEIPYSANLALGFDGGAWCGNAYGGKDGREYGRTVAKESAETREKAGDMVMSSLLHLKSFEIGELAPNITRAENGTVTLIWPWTGRMDEWTFEIWPEEDEFDEVEYDSM